MTVMLQQQQTEDFLVELDTFKQQVQSLYQNPAFEFQVSVKVYRYVLDVFVSAISAFDLWFRHSQQQIQTLTAENQELMRLNRVLEQELATHQKMQAALQYQAQQERLLDLITHRIRKSLDLKDILRTTVDEVRQFLQVDRVVIYRFKPDWNGMVTVESVIHPRYSILNAAIKDPCFGDIYADKYKQGRVQALDDIYGAEIPDCYIRLLEEYGIRANLVMPITEGDSLWGLLIAHQCSGPRQWEATDIVLMGRLSSQIAIAIQQSQLYEQVQRLATIDELTQVPNRRQFETYYDKIWRRLMRHRGRLALMMGDIDFFKPYNDTYGHPAGDTCLKQVASVLKSCLNRPSDLVARYGGEEFIMILPDTDLPGARHIADDIMAKVEDLAIKHQMSDFGYVTLSLGGVCLIPTAGRQPQNAIKAADNALYQAKSEGRNRAVLFELT